MQILNHKIYFINMPLFFAQQGVTNIIFIIIKLALNEEKKRILSFGWKKKPSGFPIDTQTSNSFSYKYLIILSIFTKTKNENGSNIINIFKFTTQSSKFQRSLRPKIIYTIRLTNPSVNNDLDKKIKLHLYFTYQPKNNKTKPIIPIKYIFIIFFMSMTIRYCYSTSLITS